MAKKTALRIILVYYKLEGFTFILDKEISKCIKQIIYTRLLSDLFKTKEQRYSDFGTGRFLSHIHELR